MIGGVSVSSTAGTVIDRRVVEHNGPVGAKSNEATFRFNLPAHLRGPELSAQMNKAVIDRARDAGAISIGDVYVSGSLPVGDGTCQYSVRVRLYFGGPAFS